MLNPSVVNLDDAPGTATAAGDDRDSNNSTFGLNFDLFRKFSTAEVPEDAEELLGAAQEYGKLGSTGAGKYVDKAEGYLHSYHTSNSQQPEGEGKAPVSERREEEEKEKTGSGSGGVGDYISKAKSFFS